MESTSEAGAFSPQYFPLDAIESKLFLQDDIFWVQPCQIKTKKEESLFDDVPNIVLKKDDKEYLPADDEQRAEPVLTEDWKSKVAEIVIHLLNHSEIRCMNEYRSLNEEASRWLHQILGYILTEAAMTALGQAPNDGPYRINFNDYAKETKRRNDVALKFTISLVNKAIYKDFCLDNNINRSFNPNTYKHRGEINERMYRHYLKRNSTRIGDNDKTDWEHQQVFLIKNGVTKQWFQYVIGVAGGKQLRRGFYDRLMKILNDNDRMEQLYAEKSKSMVKRMLGIDLEGEEEEEAIDLGRRLHVDGEHRARPKIPPHMAEFNRCLELTRHKISEFARQYSL